MSNLIIDAALLYRDALMENEAELIVPLEKSRVFYVPKMMHLHRQFWYTSDLFAFYPSEFSEEIGTDYVRVSQGTNGFVRGFYIEVLNNEDFDTPIIQRASDNLLLSFSRSLRPSYFEIDPSLLLKALKLAAFI